jgi:hemoglobin-like flavoprotein
MGCSHSNIPAEGGADFDALQARQKVFEKKMTVPLALQIAHFTPASFPLVPIISRQVNKLCTTSWNILVEQEFEGEGGTVVSGITMFYNEFYKRLAVFDNKGMFEAVLSRHSGSANKIAVKGSILVRIIKYVLAITEDSEETQLALFVLGKSHRQKHIRPWQYSVFIETLLNTLAHQLGIHATADVMYAWVNLFAFVLKLMLPPALEGLTLPTELNVNTSTIFDLGDSSDSPPAPAAPLAIAPLAVDPVASAPLRVRTQSNSGAKKGNSLTTSPIRTFDE